MAYIAILFLLMVASVLALAFTHEVGTQLSLLDDRDKAMQANYLAESAANHAMWRMLGVPPVVSLVAVDGDDAEQPAVPGPVKNNPELKLGRSQLVGMRFSAVSVPMGAKILSAHVELKAKGDGKNATALSIWGEASDDAGQFTALDNDLSSRTRTAMSVGWGNVQVWTKDMAYETPELRFIIQEIVDRPGWKEEGAVVLLFDSADLAGERQAITRETDPARAPKLVINYERPADVFDEDTYYMHSLAGGRYGYKIRDHTDTTFATIATVGAIDDVEVQQSYVQYVLPEEYALSPCLMGWWALDEGLGTRAADGSGNKNHGTLVNMSGTEWMPGAVDGGLQLPGTSDRVDLGSDTSLDLADALTLAMWVNPSIAQEALLLDKGYQSSYYMYLLADGSFKLACAVSGFTWAVVSNPGVATPGEWTHLAGSYEESTGEAVLYRNGVEVMRASGLLAPISNNSQPLVIGAASPAGGYDFSGTMDDVRVYTCALSTEEIGEIFCAGAVPIVSAGSDMTVRQAAADSTVAGSVVDPCPLGGRTLTWSKTSGPGEVVFGDPSLEGTTVSFSQEGTYVLRLTVETDRRIVFDEVTFSVLPDIYIEAHRSFLLQIPNSWLTIDLSNSPFNLPPNAVIEVAIGNSATGRNLQGGVRSAGSSVDRRVTLHEAEGGGLDVVVMHAQADSSSRVQFYAENTSAIQFTLLGYWTRGTYVERMDSFSASAHSSWVTKDLSSYGLAGGEVAEIVITNEHLGHEFLGGVRSIGFGPRELKLHESEGGGLDTVTMMVNADDTAGARIELYAQSTEVQFLLAGYWSTPPGTFTESFVNTGEPLTAGAWLDNDLSAFGVPEFATVQMALSNAEGGTGNVLGVRSLGSTLSRSIYLHEAEAGGEDFATVHVRTYRASTLQWYEALSGKKSRYYLLGWWLPIL